MQDLLQKIGVNINVTFHLIFLGLVWVRILGMASVIPFLFGKPVPRYVVVGASMVFALFVYPHIVPERPPDLSDDLLGLFMLFLKEAFYGLSIGMAVSIVFHAFEAAGAMIDNQRGMSIARILIPQLGEQGSLTGAFLFQFSLVIYLSIGGHLGFLQSFFDSYVTLPVLGYPVAGPGLLPMLDLFIDITGQVLMISVQLSAPVIIAIFLADIILGIANRVAQQINVWELGFNVKGYIGILLLFVSLTLVAGQVERYTLESNRFADQIVEDLKGREKVPGPPEAVPKEGFHEPQSGPPKVISP